MPLMGLAAQMIDDLRDMVSSKRGNAPRPEQDCKRCGKPFVPPRGSNRLYCVRVPCETARERDRREAVRARARLRNAKYREKKRERENG